jgi:hypothetical protein
VFVCAAFRQPVAGSLVFYCRRDYKVAGGMTDPVEFEILVRHRLSGSHWRVRRRCAEQWHLAGQGKRRLESSMKEIFKYVPITKSKNDLMELIRQVEVYCVLLTDWPSTDFKSGCRENFQ